MNRDLRSEENLFRGHNWSKRDKPRLRQLVGLSAVFSESAE